MNFASLIKARKVLDPLWKKSQLRGRTWGLIREDNPYSATNITMVIGNELVSVSQDPDGSLRIHEFKRTTDTLFGNTVKEIFKKENLKFKEVIDENQV